MKTGAQHGIMGEDYGISDLPQTEVPEQDLTEERNAAKFSRTKEYRRLKTHLESRIEYYQAFLPDGKTVLDPEKTMAELGQAWVVSNAIIAEFKAVLEAYEQAKETVADADRRATQ